MENESKTERVEFSRYTNFMDLFCILTEKKLRLSNPEHWKDKTDYNLLNKWRGKYKYVRSLCFFMGDETNHYWEIYAEYGCKIEFDKEKLLSKIPTKIKNGCFVQGKVEHIKQNETDLKKSEAKVPFVKQYRYRDEKEFRIAWKGKEVNEACIDIDLESIKKITISGKISKERMESLKKAILQVGGDVLKNKINRSKLFESDIFEKKFKN